MIRTYTNLRLLFLAIVTLAGLGALAAKLWEVQIERHDHYMGKLRRGSQVTVRIPSVRGIIFDKHGIALVENRASFDMDFYVPDMVKAYRAEMNFVPQVEYVGLEFGMPKPKKEANVVQIVQEAIIPRLEDLGIAENFSTERLQLHFRNNREVPFNYNQDIDFDTVAILSERNLGLPGVIVTKRPVRNYVYGALAAHLLGYVGAAKNIDSKPDIKQFTFYDPDLEGRAEIEYTMDKYLCGKPGKRVLLRNVKGVIEGEIPEESEDPVQGDNVFLTIDARLQYRVENIMRTVGRGAAVVVDTRNGDILAMVTVPSYDPNAFIPFISSSDWEKLREDDTDPLINRALSGFAPGSTFKTLTACAMLQTKRAGSGYSCGGSVTYGRSIMKCTGVHGSLPLEDAIKRSCNCYFYKGGNAARGENIEKIGLLLGFGQKSDLPLTSESPGIMPGPQWLRRINPRDSWGSGATANTSIGQGSVLASPLQMAMLTATIANGGTAYYPRLVDRIIAQDGNVTLHEEPKVRASLIDDAGLTKSDIDRIRKGMWKCINEEGGTAFRASGLRALGAPAAGKTGTAQNWERIKGRAVRSNHVWFTTFAPYNEPRYAVAVIVQNGASGGGVAAPIAAEILDACFKLERYDTANKPVESEGGEAAEGATGVSPVVASVSLATPTQLPEDLPAIFQIAALKPAKGHRTFVSSVDFKSANPVTYATTDAAEDSASDSTRATEQQATVAAAPDVRPATDARGKVTNKERKASGSRGNIFDFFNRNRNKNQ